MSATTTRLDSVSATPASPTPATWSAAEVVRPLTGDQKYALLGTLLRELVQNHGDTGQIVIHPPGDEAIGYFTPMAAARAAVLRKRGQVPAELRETVNRSIAHLDLDDCVTAEEMDAIIRGDRVALR